MEIILKQDIIKLGHKDDLVIVKDGYAINYLIPKGMAIQATKSAKLIQAENKRQQAHKEQKYRKDAEELAEKLKDVVLTINAKTSTTGKIFGSVTNLQIADELAKKGFDIDKKKISFDTVKEIGNYKANVILFKDIKVDVQFEVVSE
jgi:large subunit ribosomal protein L9